MTEEWNDAKRRPLLLSLDLKESDLHRQVLSCGFPLLVDEQLRNVSSVYFTFINLIIGSYSHIDEKMVLTVSVS